MGIRVGLDYSLGAKVLGQQADNETGILYNYLRDYDPSLGRYMESDPIGLEGGINTYSYVAASPLSANDPLGLFDPAGFSVGVGVASSIAVAPVVAIVAGVAVVCPTHR